MLFQSRKWFSHLLFFLSWLEWFLPALQLLDVLMSYQVPPSQQHQPWPTGFTFIWGRQQWGLNAVHFLLSYQTVAAGCSESQAAKNKPSHYVHFGKQFARQALASALKILSISYMEKIYSGGGRPNALELISTMCFRKKGFYLCWQCVFSVWWLSS